jgi:hypothetical protein
MPSALLSILISCLLIFASILFIEYIRQRKLKRLFAVEMAVFLVCLTVITALLSKTGVIIFVATFALYIRKKLFYLIIIPLAFANSVIFFSSNTAEVNSIKGRYFILQNLLQLVQEKSIGNIVFARDYNLCQAKYFQINGLGNTYALLADNTFFAFNDYLQFIAEYSFLALIIMVLLFFWLYTYKPKCMISKAAYFALLAWVLSGFFYYVYQNIYSLLLGYTFLSILLLRAYNFRIVLPILLILAFSIVYQIVTHFWAVSKIEQLTFYVKSGYTKQTIMLKPVERCYLSEYPDYWILLITAYRDIGHYQEAFEAAENAKQRFTNDELYCLSAYINLKNGDFKKAESDYLTSVYMVPKKFKPKYELMNFYLATNQIEKALYWAKLIYSFPIKIPSEMINKYKLAALKIIQLHNSN